MKQTPVHPTNQNIQIRYGKPVCFVGSCFSNEMSKKCEDSGFKVASNPYGVIFNPLSIAMLLDRTLQVASFEDTIIKQGNVYLSWLANRTIFGYEKEVFSSDLKEIASSFYTALSKADTLFITFGTAWGYKLKETEEIVANCHKLPGSNFKKVFVSSSEIVVCFQRLLLNLKETFPKLDVVFTVSPVRHTKDGLVENNLSKSHLITAVHELVNVFDFVHYFPSYEIVIDELRDYAFYKADGVHPNEFAVQRIWEFFKNRYLDDTTSEMLKAFEYLNLQAKHRHIHEASEETITFKKKLKHQITTFKDQNPNILLTQAMQVYVH